MKLRNINLGKHHTQSTIKKISKSRKGTILSEQAKINIGLGHKGSKHWNWQGGISNNQYPVDWTNTLKKAIREKYKYICQICNEYAWIVHHIDYNKDNCSVDNLIIVCRSCHAKTNSKLNRKNWIEYFRKLSDFKK